MRKLIAILLLLIMPLQLSWAAMSTYCSHHETGVSAKHFGHHGDEDASSKVSFNEDDSPQSGSSGQAGEHHACHTHGGVSGIFGATPLLISTSPVAGSLQTLDLAFPPTNYISLIERPNWRNLA